jgi:hypothetical protein
MRLRKTTIRWCTTLIFVATVFATYALFFAGPRYRGRRVENWIDDLNSKNRQVRSAARETVYKIDHQILARLCAERLESKPKMAPQPLQKIAAKLPSAVQNNLSYRLRSSLGLVPYHNQKQFSALLILGSIGLPATNALPELIKIMGTGDATNKFYDLREYSADILYSLGKRAREGIPEIRKTFARTDETGKFWCAAALSGMTELSKNEVEALSAGLTANFGRNTYTDGDGDDFRRQKRTATMIKRQRTNARQVLGEIKRLLANATEGEEILNLADLLYFLEPDLAEELEPKVRSFLTGNRPERAMAVQLLWKMKRTSADEALPILDSILDPRLITDNSHGNNIALTTLEFMGSAAKPLRPKLKDLKENRWVGWAAQKVLWQLAPQDESNFFNVMVTWAQSYSTTLAFGAGSENKEVRRKCLAALKTISLSGDTLEILENIGKSSDHETAAEINALIRDSL